MNTEQCPHTHTRLRKRGATVQRQCLAPDCLLGVGPITALDRFSKSQQRVLEPWVDGAELDFGPEAA